MTIARLRTGIVVLAVVLLVAIAGLLGFARYERERLIRDLPEKLGLQIEKSADGFTLSKSVKGHTLFTIHASKAVQYKSGGHATLHDVNISLYGPNGDRADRIRGAEFDYDNKTGIATAAGDVEIDLQAPAGQAVTGKGDAAEAGKDGDPAKRTIHVKTSGLVFDKNSGMASTPNLVEFRMPQGAGHAVGASYDSREGVLALTSAVRIDSSSNGKPLSIEAAHAQILRDTRQAFLLNAVTNYVGERTASDEAIVYFRPDGSPEHVDAKGHVDISSDAGQELKAQMAKIVFDEHSQPQQADMGGGLFFVSNDKVHHMHGAAVEAKLQFGEAAALRHIRLLNAVSFVDQQVTLPDDPNGSTTRQVRAEQIDVDFVADPAEAGHSLAHQVLATGNATVVLHTISAKHPQQNTTIVADKLLADIAGGNAITGVTGTGHTRLVDVAADGATQTSSGDTLVIGFLPVSGRRMGAKKGEIALPATQIQSAMQQGNVEISQTGPVGSGKAEAVLNITAQRAAYQAADQVLHLDGSPRFKDGSLDLTSNVMEYGRTTGIATATGNVKATYLQRPGDEGATATAAGRGPLVLGGQGPAHIIADKATLNRGSAVGTGGVANGKGSAAGKAAKGANVDAIFSGHARLWQGTNSISAPVIELLGTGQSLKAHGEALGPGSAEDRVTAILATAATAQHGASVDRIQSRELTYSEGDREATFLGSVMAQGASGIIHSDEAAVYLVPSSTTVKEVKGASSASLASSKGDEKATASPLQATRSSQIDRIVASGHIVLDQPGRKATGDKLVYTAQDGNFTLTGSALAPPRLVDQIHGTVTGASLVFNTRDDSVSVSGGQARASTDTRVRK